jgi:hypothetical protein
MADGQERPRLSEIEALASAGQAMGYGGAVKVLALTDTVRSLLVLAGSAHDRGTRLRNMAETDFTLAGNAYVGMANRIRNAITEHIDIEDEA